MVRARCFRLLPGFVCGFGALLGIAPDARAQSDVTIQLTSPFNGTGFNNPSSIAVQANATASSGSITRVDFFAGTTLIGTATAAPYAVSWANMATGSYALKAVAIDDQDYAHPSSIVNIAVFSGQPDNGTLGAPVASLASGTYGPSHSVTLVADASATIRFTTDGSAPSVTSPAYTSPIALAASMTLKAQAFASGWSPSTITTATYTILTNPLVVTAKISPPPNAAGWNRTPVTVTFACSDDGAEPTCPDPIQFSDEGAGQSLTVTAHDSASRETPLTVVVNIDKTPAAIAVSSPADGASTTDATTTLNASVSDGLSGISSVTCNGVAAAVVNGAVQCSISLRPGMNSVILHALDVAGNSFSKGLRITQFGTHTVLKVTPSAVKLAAGDSKTLSASSEYGVVSDVTWTSSDETILSVATDGSGTVTGVTAGQVTVTATTGTLSATATVTVLGVVLAPGDMKWSLPAMAGAVSGPIPAHRFDPSGSGDDEGVVVSSSSGPDLFTVGYDWSQQIATINAFTSDGVQLWSEQTLSASPTAMFADMYGGMINLSFDENYHQIVQKIAGSAAAPPWQYQAANDGWVAAPAQSQDGTVYFVEAQYDGDNSDGYVVGLDGLTGQVKFRSPLPSFSLSYSADSRCELQSLFIRMMPSFGQIGIGADGAAYLEIETGHRTWSPVCDYPDTWHSLTDCCLWVSAHNGAVDPGAGSYDYVSELKIVRVGANGETTISSTLAQWSASGPDTDDQGEGPPPVFGGASFGAIVSDGLDGALASWSYADEDGNPLPGFVRARAAGVSTLPGSLAPYGNNPVSLTTSSGTAYLWDFTDPNGAVAAYDVPTWSRLWTGPPTLSPIFETAAGNLVAIKYNDTYDAASLIEIDRSGVTVGTTSLPLVWSPTLVKRGVRSLHAADAATGGPSEIATNDYVEADVQSRYMGAPSFDFCLNPPATSAHKSLAPEATYTYGGFFGDWADFAEKQASVSNAFLSWKYTNVANALNVSFAAADPSVTPDFKIYRGVIVNQNGVEVAGGYDATGKKLPSGHVVGGLIEITNNVGQFISNNQGVYRAMLHEVGHAMGLNHTGGADGTSVMNMLGGKDDVRDAIPNAPTSCDARMAKQYSTQ